MGRSLKEGELQQLKSRADVYSIISGYVNLKKSGKNYLGLCPFHEEKTPSFSVDPVKQLYHCFGCGEGGDIITFIMKMENISFIEAAEFLAKKVNYELKYTYSESGDYKAENKKKNRLLELNELAKKYYKYILFNSKHGRPALKYLHDRGFDEKTIKEFEIGYSMDKWESLVGFATKRGFSKDELVESGLALESTKRKGSIYDRFRARIMFPIKDVVGKTIAFGGRILIDDKKRKTAKYINSPETKVYSKSRNIFGIYESKNDIVRSDRALIVEGYTDVMALSKVGIGNATASLGTALTSEQVKLISRFTKNIILVFDSDEAGVNASMRGFERLKEYNRSLDLYHENNIDMRVAVLEPGFDPADYVFEKGKKEFLKRIEESKNIIDFAIDLILKKYDLEDLNSKMRASDELIRFISGLSSQIIQEEYIKKIALKLGLKEDLLLENMLKVKAKDNFFENNEKEEKIPPQKKVELEALKIMINGIGDRLHELINIDSRVFIYDDTRQLFELIKKVADAEKSNLNFPIKIPSEYFESEEQKNLYNFLVFADINYSEPDKVSSEILLNLKRLYIDKKAVDLRKKMAALEKKQRSYKDKSTEQYSDIEEGIRKIGKRLEELEVRKRELK